MNSLLKNKRIGTILFYVLWPLIWLYAPLQKRVRVIIRCEKEILAVKNWFGPSLWQLPGGGMKKGESIASSASREINEELGLKIDNTEFKLLTEKIVTVHQFGLKFRYYYLLVDIAVKPKIELSSEICSAQWVEAEEINLPPAITATL
jgi:8-oxo-dGTP pyrophosphatase MutT (NUDIX family)